LSSKTPSVPSGHIGACGSVSVLRSPIGKGERVAAVVGKRCFCLDALWCPVWSPNRFEYRGRAIRRVKSAARRYAADFRRKSGPDATNCPRTIEVGLWCRQGLHQSLLDEKNYPKDVIPDGAAESLISCRKVTCGPRSPLRSGGDGIVLDGYLSRSVLVTVLVNQTANEIVSATYGSR